jgi:hypothetical protein
VTSATTANSNYDARLAALAVIRECVGEYEKSERIVFEKALPLLEEIGLGPEVLLLSTVGTIMDSINDGSWQMAVVVIEGTWGQSGWAPSRNEMMALIDHLEMLTIKDQASKTQ